MSTEFGTAETPAFPAARHTRDKRYLFGPIADFLCLGGSSLLILPLLLLVPVEPYRAQLAWVMLLMAHFINHPHFAHSYQLFYRNFRTKAFTNELGSGMRARYILSGIVVPLFLLAFFLYCLLSGDAQLLGYGGNIMALFVGWHYVKQGYGMLMLDAVLKRKFFDERQKKALLVNSYAVWIAAWLGANDYVATQHLFELQYYSFDIPDPLVQIARGTAVATSLWAAWAIFTHRRARGSLLVNGIMAYVVSLYAWLLFVRINPLWLLVVPALHSLQYLVVVWRFELNYESEQLGKEDFRANSLVRRYFGNNFAAHLALFGFAGIVLGFIAFWGLPVALGAVVPYDREIFGGTLFLFMAWIFINVHHYFLDNVMWRRENTDTKRFLFS
ncbi:hypothetical protein [Aestuariivirga sp.]|uniref:hypothetical protein n=1 Tax=Aestuariivirga sp. TaxID=2650926 RepID=UPI00391C4E22